VQSYYAQVATAAGWAPDGALQTFHTDRDPSHDGLEAKYRKLSEGYFLQMDIDCFVDTSYSGGYTLYLQTPPDLRATTWPRKTTAATVLKRLVTKPVIDWRHQQTICQR